MRLQPLISHTGILMTFYLSIILEEEGHNSYPLVCRRLAETVSLQRRQICYRWGTPAYWSLVPRSSTNCAPLLADLFLYSYESEFLQKLVKDKKIHEATAFNFTYRYIDDVLSINNSKTVSPQRRQICYRWGTPAYWSLVPRSSMFYLFEFCLKNMWNCSLIG
jgi:hypothetical protein